MKKLVLAAALAATGLIGAAHAAPLLQIVDINGALATATNQEAIGDPGGTNYANPATAGASAGPGMPTALGGWAVGPGFAPDTAFGGAMGISGWDASYLYLTKAGPINFQFMGYGDATNQDHFQLQLGSGSGWTTMWDNKSAGNGTCGVIGTTPDCPFAGSQFTVTLNAGLIPFQFVNLTTPATATNDGKHNPSPDKDGFPGYFLGMDPYLSSPFQNWGTVAYVGFTDLPCTPGGGGDCDHDYEDLVLRISSVPEPGSLFLVGAGLLGLAGLRRRKV
jgi:hypothetical protein